MRESFIENAGDDDRGFRCGGGRQGSVPFDGHAARDDALGDEFLRGVRRKFPDERFVGIQNTADVGKKDERRLQ